LSWALPDYGISMSFLRESFLERFFEKAPTADTGRGEDPDFFHGVSAAEARRAATKSCP
jgi:hypothetical protein